MQVTREAVALSAQDLRHDLEARGLLVTSVRAADPGLGRWRNRVGAEDLANFVQEFGALLRAGLTVSESLSLSLARPDCPRLEHCLSKVHGDIADGSSLSEAMSAHPDVFDHLLVTTLAVGEKSGDLAGALARYQDYLRHRIAMRRQLSKALAYPVFLLIALVVILGVLFLFVLPRFVALYSDFGAALPWPTQVMIGVVEWLPALLAGGIALLISARTGWRRWGATPGGRLKRERLIGRLPVVGGLRRLAAVGLFGRTLSALLAAGLPLVAALAAAQTVMAGEHERQGLAGVAEAVGRGEGLANALRATKLLPEAALRMVAVGEASGSLSEMLSEIARFHEEQLAARLGRAMSLIEPLLMLLMGVLVGTVIIVMYLPVFHLADVIR